MSDAACSDPMCSFRAEHHRIAELEGKLAEAEERNELLVTQVGDMDARLVEVEKERQQPKEV